MAEVKVFENGNYRYIKGVQQYSAGVAAQPGYSLRRVRFEKPVPLAEGFRRIKEIIQATGRPLTAFCACELRSPAPFTEQGFRDFNAIYIGTLKEWGIYSDGQDNPVSRSNVCPEYDAPSGPSFHAFSFTVEGDENGPSFVVAGSAEAPETGGNYRDHAICLDDVSPSGMSTKAAWVLDEMERRLSALDATWQDTTAVQVYTVHDFHHTISADISKRSGALQSGLTWNVCRPPILGLDYEMDCRRVADEKVAK